MPAEQPRLVLFGAGMTGRGQVAQMAHESGWQLTLVDSNRQLVQTLRQTGQYTVRLISSSPRDVIIGGYRMLHTNEAAEIAEALLKADLVVTAVRPTNLADLGPILAQGLGGAVALGRTGPLNIVAAENMNDSSQTLRRQVEKHLSRDEAERFRGQFGFPNSMIARVVPVAADPLLIVAEDYNEWTADVSARIGDPPDLPGLEWVDNQEARLQRKLYIHNTGHATCAYLGTLKGYRFVHESARDPQILERTRQAIYESGAAVAARHGFSDLSVKDYAHNLLQRLPGDALPDSLARVIREPVRKLGPEERLLGPVLLCEEYGLPHDGLCRAIAAVLLSRASGDAQFDQLAGLVDGLGPRGAVEEIIGRHLHDDTGAAIEREYSALKLEVY